MFKEKEKRFRIKWILVGFNGYDEKKKSVKQILESGGGILEAT